MLLIDVFRCAFLLPYSIYRRSCDFLLQLFLRYDLLSKFFLPSLAFLNICIIMHPWLVIIVYDNMWGFINPCNYFSGPGIIHVKSWNGIVDLVLRELIPPGI